MGLSVKAREIVAAIDREDFRMGELKKIAKEIKRDHDLALELWGTGAYGPRMLATLIFDKKQLTQTVIDDLVADLSDHDDAERDRLSEWLLANQLTKDRKTRELLASWADAPSPTVRRLYWYHEARLRWTGKAPPEDNSAALLNALEANMAGEAPEVQWAMNFCAGWIGVHEPGYRERCIALGERLGLYRDDPVPRNCTPGYLPEFIRVEVAKRV
ncbi:MAG: DNA alkylation repair protein [Pseudomonadota bacterium]